MTFRTEYGHYKYEMIPFGLSNALASFKSYINKILSKKLNIIVIVYLNDIIIHRNNFEQAHVDAI